MSYIPVTLNGVIYPKTRMPGDQPKPVVFIGYAWRSDLSVGGGPVEGGGDLPAHPIVPPGGYPHPEHPIVLPPVDPQPPEPPDTGAPDSDGWLKPPPPDGGWAFHAEYGWCYFPKGSGPKK
jgi:hypothetical protein